MRIPVERHLALDLRIHDLARDFRLLDVWTLPEVEGSLADFDRAVAMVLAADPAHGSSAAARFLWRAREVLGAWLGLDKVTEPSGEHRSLRDRLPDDLRGTADGLQYEHLPFVPVYRTPTEYAAEVSNATVHGILYLAWVPNGEDTYRGQLAIYVKPRGRLGSAYLTFIKPFRYLVVYPALERQLAREWREGASPAGR